jgi:hypothetical protein
MDEAETARSSGGPREDARAEEAETMTEVDVMLAFQAYDEIEATGDEELRAHWDALSAAVREGRPKPGASLTRLTEYVNSYA